MRPAQHLPWKTNDVGEASAESTLSTVASISRWSYLRPGMGRGEQVTLRRDSFDRVARQRLENRGRLQEDPGKGLSGNPDFDFVPGCVFMITCRLRRGWH